MQKTEQGPRKCQRLFSVEDLHTQTVSHRQSPPRARSPPLRPIGEGGGLQEPLHSSAQRLEFGFQAPGELQLLPVGFIVNSHQCGDKGVSLSQEAIPDNEGFSVKMNFLINVL